MIRSRCDGRNLRCYGPPGLASINFAGNIVSVFMEAAGDYPHIANPALLQ
jgi:hypothetical protein